MAQIDDYTAIANDLLGLETRPNKGLMLGEYIPAEAPKVFERSAEKYLKKLAQATSKYIDDFWAKLREIQAEYGLDDDSNYYGHDEAKKRLGRLRDAHAENVKPAKERAFLTLQDFYRYHQVSGTRLSTNAAAELLAEANEALQSDGTKAIRLHALYKFYQYQRRSPVPASFEGYRQYVQGTNKPFYNLLNQKLPAVLDEEPRITHSYILGTTKTGKTELLKSLAHCYYSRRNYCSTVIIDPGGDISDQIAKSREFNGRENDVIYIDRRLDNFKVPIINPFESDQLNELEREIWSGELLAVVISFFRAKNDTFTPNMEMILRKALLFLIDTPNTSLVDLVDLMMEDPTLLAKAQQSSRKSIATFFMREWIENTNLKTAKQAIAGRISGLNDLLGTMITGKSTIDLEKALNGNKTVILNLSPAGFDVFSTQALGSFVVAMVMSIAKRRAKLNKHQRPQTQLLVDECHNFITAEIKTIIRESRKFGLHLTLAQQEYGGDMPPDIRKTVIKTTEVKVAGRSALDETKITGDMVGVDPEAVNSLPLGHFYYRNGSQKSAFRLHSRSDLIDYRNCISGTAWQERRKKMVTAYYRTPEKRIPYSPPVEPEKPKKKAYVERPTAPAPAPAPEYSPVPVAKQPPPPTIKTERTPPPVTQLAQETITTPKPATPEKPTEPPKKKKQRYTFR